ncbi:hypothetical protein J6590_013949 [Homalodisca vitripennis]|nr:hypothetical protein J6590_013949 [Homalodisca vitripennis]
MIDRERCQCVGRNRDRKSSGPSADPWGTPRKAMIYLSSVCITRSRAWDGRPWRGVSGDCHLDSVTNFLNSKTCRRKRARFWQVPEECRTQCDSWTCVTLIAFLPVLTGVEARDSAPLAPLQFLAVRSSRGTLGGGAGPISFASNWSEHHTGKWYRLPEIRSDPVTCAVNLPCRVTCRYVALTGLRGATAFYPAGHISNLKRESIYAMCLLCPLLSESSFSHNCFFYYYETASVFVVRGFSESVHINALLLTIFGRLQLLTKNLEEKLWTRGHLTISTTDLNLGRIESVSLGISNRIIFSSNLPRTTRRRSLDRGGAITCQRLRSRVSGLPQNSRWQRRDNRVPGMTSQTLSFTTNVGNARLLFTGQTSTGELYGNSALARNYITLQARSFCAAFISPTPTRLFAAVVCLSALHMTNICVSILDGFFTVVELVNGIKIKYLNCPSKYIFTGTTGEAFRFETLLSATLPSWYGKPLNDDHLL